MNPSRTPLRRILIGLAPVIALVLALGTLAVVAHHHDDGASSHGHCAVCIAGPTTALPASAAPTLAPPALEGSRLAPAPIDLPRSLARAVARGRAPPAA